MYERGPPRKSDRRGRFSLPRTGNEGCCSHSAMFKVLGWIVLIIFLIGLLVVIGVFDFIF
jgi:hypothetical protein